MPTTANETLVAMQTEQGFRVYAPTDPSRSYIVSGTAAYPACTCPEFEEQVALDPDFRCRHILAVESQLPQPETPLDEDNNHTAANQPNPAVPPSNGAATASGPLMVIKRSVSPDGRINSLSVEFACPVSGLTTGAIKSRAAKTLDLQNEIVAGFLQSHEYPPEEGNGHNGGSNGNDGATPAELLDIRGMQTRWGWRMFINVQVNGQTLKLFGKTKELGEHLTAAGYPDLARNISTGVQLNVPCRVTIRPSDDGRYQNIERVFPANGNGGSRGRSRS